MDRSTADILEQLRQTTSPRYPHRRAALAIRARARPADDLPGSHLLTDLAMLNQIRRREGFVTLLASGRGGETT